MFYAVILVSILLIGVSWYLTKDFFNPVNMFTGIWLVVYLLYGLRISRLQAPLSDKTNFVLICMMMIFFVSFILIYYRERTKKTHIKPIISSTNNSKTISDNRIFFCFKVWLVVEIIETIYSGGLPLLWKIMGINKTYFDYGMPTLHGLMNAFGLVIMLCSFYKVLTGNENKIKHISMIVFIVCMYLLMITRQVIITAFVEMAIIYIYTKKRINWKLVVSIVFVCIIAFGIIGNIRTGYDEFISVSLVDTNLPSWAIGFLWVYMYLCMSLANVNNLLSMSFEYPGWGYVGEIYIPTVISRMIFNDSSNSVNYLVTNAFNVSGFFADFYVAKGMFGFVFIVASYGAIGGYLYAKLKKNFSEKYILFYAIYLQIVVLSFFYNHLFYLPSSFQLVVIWLLYSRIRLKK